MTKKVSRLVLSSFQLVLIFVSLAMLNGCGSDNDQQPAVDPAITTITTTAATQIPAPILNATLIDGEIKVFVVIDGDNDNRIEMIINEDTASVELVGLAQAEHDFEIIFEHIDVDGIIILAKSDTKADFSAGGFDLNFDAADYNLDFDKDLDGVNNAGELFTGTNPRVFEVSLPVETAIPLLTDAILAAGELRAYVSVDGDVANRIEMDIDFDTHVASGVVLGLIPVSHDLSIEFEYTDTDTKSTFKLVRIIHSVDLAISQDALVFDSSAFNADVFNTDNDGENNLNELLAGTNPLVSKSTLIINTEIPILNDAALAAGTLRAFVIIDNDQLNRIPLDIDLNTGFAKVEISGLSSIVHNIVIEFEYTDLEGSLILAQLGTGVDMTLDGVSININRINFNDNLDDDADGINNLAELLAGSDPRIAGSITQSALLIEAVIPELGASALNAGVLSSFVTIDGGARIEMTVDLVSLISNVTIPNLTQAQHSFFVSLEYTDATGTLVLATARSSVDLASGDLTITLNMGDFDALPFDEDGDGASNLGELLAGSDPRVPGIPIAAATATLSFDDIKTFHFSWTDVPDATFYQLAESADGVVPFAKLDNDILPGTQVFDHIVPLYGRLNARYVLRSCNDLGCVEGDVINIVGPLVESMGYFKPDGSAGSANESQFGRFVSLSGDGNTFAVGEIGSRISIFVLTNGQWQQQARIQGNDAVLNDVSFGLNGRLSHDGNTLVVSAHKDSSDAQVINGAHNLLAADSGAVYVYVRNGSSWSEQAFIKADNADTGDLFGVSLDISKDGSTLVVGAVKESSGNASDKFDNTALDAGAAYVFNRNSAGAWGQTRYLKASNLDAGDRFGGAVAVSGDGLTLAIGSALEDSDAVGIGQDQLNNLSNNSGAIYVFALNATNEWVQEEYIKASNADPEDQFGHKLALSDDGTTLGVTTILEDSNDPNDPANNDVLVGDFGAAYIFVRNDARAWAEQAYIKPADMAATEQFGQSISLSDNGDTLAVGDSEESSRLIGLNNGVITADVSSGAGYVFIREVDGSWKQQAHIKASNTDAGDNFGVSVDLSGDGSALAVGAHKEDGGANGVNGDALNNNVPDSGAVYLY